MKTRKEPTRNPREGAVRRLLLAIVSGAVIVAVVLFGGVIAVNHLADRTDDPGQGEVFTEPRPGSGNPFMPKPSPTDEEKYLYGPLSTISAQVIMVKVEAGDTYWGVVRAWVALLSSPPYGPGVSFEEADRVTANVVAATRKQNPGIDLDNLPSEKAPGISTLIRAKY